ncbi:hypothetical protein SAMN05192544_1025137 [Paraburkholderia hospita]|nr:hypothetical protein SAMN05192544_1025137 [Paraburkholderia hospita]
MAACLVFASAAAGAQTMRGDSGLLVHWELMKGGVRVAQHSFDPKHNHVDEWRDIRDFAYRDSCVPQGLLTTVQYGQHVWINSGAIVDQRAAMDVRVEARSMPAVQTFQTRGCDVPTPVQSSHDIDVSISATTDEEMVADQWDDYRLIVRLVPRQ